MSRMYKSGEYCKDVKCPIYERKEASKKGERGISLAGLEKVCEQHCMHTGREFYKWLKEHNYLVIQIPPLMQGVKLPKSHFS